MLAIDYSETMRRNSLAQPNEITVGSTSQTSVVSSYLKLRVKEEAPERDRLNDNTCLQLHIFF